MTQRLSRLESDEVLSALDFHFAVAMGRISGETNSDVLLAAALVSRQLGRGHVCFDLNSEYASTLGIPSDVIHFPDADSWLQLLAQSKLVSKGEKQTPLVLDESRRLYLYRYWQHENIVAHYIQNTASAAAEEVDDVVLLDGLARLFPIENDTNNSDADSRPDFQRLAAVVATERKLCVISGGPGTGKTFTVVKILALAIEQALAKGIEPPKISLVAPTGKAAARLVESIRNSKLGLLCSSATKDAIPETASTLHRCLGSIGGSSTEFRHNQHNRLSTDIFLIDEASMIDLGLMRRLVDALPDHARLILIGDMDQLASVEAGAVLGDICNAGGYRKFSQRFCQRIFSLTGETIASDKEPDEPSDEDPVSDDNAIGDCVIRLEISYRFGSDSGIALLANAIKDGDSRAALAVIDKYPELSLLPSSPDGRASSALESSVAGGFSKYMLAESAAEKLSRFDDYRVLCVRRSGVFGVGALNELVESVLCRNGSIVRTQDNYVGRPILVTANNYQLDLFNGDIGLMLRQENALRAHFVGADGEIRTVTPGRLGQHETVYAMSVHKSQGSEFQKVAIVLPHTMSPIMTREVIYTAVTRAKETIEIHGSAEILARMIEERRVRSSGLRSILWDGSQAN